MYFKTDFMSKCIFENGTVFLLETLSSEMTEVKLRELVVKPLIWPLSFVYFEHMYK